MAYSGLIRRFLISCPSDVLIEDLGIIRHEIDHWNGVYGEGFGTAVLPISWSQHAAAEFGDHPQNLINKQLVDSCDGCIAIFANRIGTPTEEAESGTAEEIQRLAESGKQVSVLRCCRPVDASRLDREQSSRLDDYLTKIRSKALVLPYSTEAELQRHVNTILAHAVSRETAQAEQQLAATPIAEVWPRVDSSEDVRSDAKGRIHTSRDWHLVLHNAGNAAARDVRFELDDDSWAIIRDAEGDEPDVAILAPNGEARFFIAASMGTSSQTLCTVTWVDDRGPQKNSATLRLM